jgi:hypothetical protein
VGYNMNITPDLGIVSVTPGKAMQAESSCGKLAAGLGALR